MLFHRAVGTTSAFPEFHKPLHALPLAVDLGRKPEERIGSLMPLAKINQSVEIRGAVLSSGTSLCLVLFPELHRAPPFPERLLLSPVMRLFVLHWTGQGRAVTLQAFPSRWRGTE